MMKMKIKYFLKSLISQNIIKNKGFSPGKGLIMNRNVKIEDIIDII